jgi:hypothetical protein
MERRDQRRGGLVDVCRSDLALALEPGDEHVQVLGGVRLHRRLRVTQRGASALDPLWPAFDCACLGRGELLLELAPLGRPATVPLALDQREPGRLARLTSCALLGL